MEKIQAMLARDPNDVFLHFSLGMEYVQAGKPDQAVAQFKQVLELDPRYIAAYPQQANALIGMNRKEEAKVVLKQGIDVAGKVGDRHAADNMSNMLGLIN